MAAWRIGQRHGAWPLHRHQSRFHPRDGVGFFEVKVSAGAQRGVAVLSLRKAFIIHPVRVPKGRTPSNLRQGLLRPQSEVGNRAGDWRAGGTLLINSKLYGSMRNVHLFSLQLQKMGHFFHKVPFKRKS